MTGRISVVRPRLPRRPFGPRHRLVEVATSSRAKPPSCSLVSMNGPSTIWRRPPRSAPSSPRASLERLAGHQHAGLARGVLERLPRADHALRCPRASGPRAASRLRRTPVAPSCSHLRDLVSIMQGTNGRADRQRQRAKSTACCDDRRVNTTDTPRPRFARLYPALAERADRRGAAEHRRRLLDGLHGRVDRSRGRQAVSTSPTTRPRSPT